jgi:hypothetical protein
MVAACAHLLAAPNGCSLMQSLTSTRSSRSPRSLGGWIAATAGGAGARNARHERGSVARDGICGGKRRKARVRVHGARRGDRRVGPVRKGWTPYHYGSLYYHSLYIIDAVALLSFHYPPQQLDPCGDCVGLLIEEHTFNYNGITNIVY